MIESSYFWINIVFLAIGTLAIRGAFILFSSRLHISPRWREIFSYIPAAILPAFVAPAVFFHQGHSSLLLGKERFVVIILATAVAYWAKNTLMTVVTGLLFLYLFSTFL